MLLVERLVETISVDMIFQGLVPPKVKGDGVKFTLTLIATSSDGNGRRRKGDDLTRHGIVRRINITIALEVSEKIPRSASGSVHG